MNILTKMLSLYSYAFTASLGYRESDDLAILARPLNSLLSG